MAVQGLPARKEGSVGFLDAAVPKSSERMLPAADSTGAGAKMIVLAPGGYHRPEDAGRGIGPARGLLLGLAIGLVVWVVIIMVVWRVFAHQA